MKNPKVFGIIVVLALIMLPMMSCATALKGRYEGTTYNIAIPAKDFEILGVVRVETTVSRARRNGARGNGEYITYDALLKEAEAKGGHGIVNVMIDRKVKITFFKVTDTYYGTALAVKYTNAVAPNTPISPGSWNVVSSSDIW